MVDIAPENLSRIVLGYPDRHGSLGKYAGDRAESIGKYPDLGVGTIAVDEVRSIESVTIS
jgi:hypothetical protein